MLVVALLAAESAALAHEYDHALHQHDAPCALHLYANHFGKAAPAAVAVADFAPLADSPLPEGVCATSYGLLTTRRTRAPPLLSSS